MDTPICDFVRRYAEDGTMRLHMPGHKGVGTLGCEALDITEIRGADSLYEADGIIHESERNASYLFGCPTYYSTEGSSLCIRAMLYLVSLYAREMGRRPLVLAGRNAHKTFLSAVALLDFDVKWLYPPSELGYLSCNITPSMLEEQLSGNDEKPVALYVTSPDYLGNVLDIAGLAAVCHRHGMLLLVDNAHGAYLKFLPGAGYPMDAGADMCCDSAHKTLPVLTGGAYLHIGSHLPALFQEQVKTAMALFGSTSPSYLILQSLDAANAIMSDRDYIASLIRAQQQVSACRETWRAQGLNALVSQEPLKITLYPRTYGYTGVEVAEYLRAHGIECEFADPDFVVLMITPGISAQDMARVAEVLCALPHREAVVGSPPVLHRPVSVTTVRDAMLSPAETLPVEQCVGRVVATATVGCPPAVPIVVSGEVIDESTLAAFAYYGITSCTVVK